MDTDDIVETILGDQYNDIDISDYMDACDQAEAFRELVSVYALYKPEAGLTHLENRSECLSNIGEFIENTLTTFVARKEKPGMGFSGDEADHKREIAKAS